MMSWFSELIAIELETPRSVSELLTLEGSCLVSAANSRRLKIAQKALSCVYRTGQMFGAAHIIDVLLGGDTERIRKFRHDELSTYGIGKEVSRDEWRSVIRLNVRFCSTHVCWHKKSGRRA